MTLTFSLLVVDDQPATISGAIALLDDHLQEKGFRLKYDVVAIESGDTSSLGNYESGAYDLAIIDFNLGDPNMNGIEEAKYFRNKNQYNELIFYSGQAGLSNLRSELSEAAVDGVFLSTRENLGEALIGVTDIVIGKLTNVNFMRGIAMAEVAEIDVEMLTTLIDIFEDSANADLQELATRIQGKLADKKTTHFEKTVKRFEKDSLSKILEDGKTVTSAEIYQLIIWLLQEIGVMGRSKKKSDRQLWKYNNKVLKPRNILAHAVEKQVQGQPPVLCFKKTGESPSEIDEEWMIGYRRTLWETKEEIKSICNNLLQKLPGRDIREDA